MKVSPEAPSSLNRVTLLTAWIAAVAGLVLFVVLLCGGGARQRLATEQFEEPSLYSKESVTGYEKGVRRWLVQDNSQGGLHTIMQAQELAQQGGLRLRKVGYDNAPEGRQVASSSPHRWWLVVLGWIQHEISGHPMGAALEEAALYADGVLFLTWMVLSSLVVWRRHGGTVAAWWVAAGCLLFSFTASFTAGAPDSSGLAYLFLASAAYFLVPNKKRPDLETRDGVISGVLLGLCVWVQPEAGLFAGLGMAALAPWWIVQVPGDDSASVLRLGTWRRWSWAVAATIFGAFLFEALPERLTVGSLSHVHAFHGLILVGVLEASQALRGVVRGGRRQTEGKMKALLVVLLGVLPLAAAVFFCFREPGQGLFSLEGSAWSFTKMPEAPVGSIGGIVSNGAFLIGWLSSVLVVAAAVWGVFRAPAGADRNLGAVWIGGLAVVVSLAFFRNSLWGAATAFAFPLAVVQFGNVSGTRVSRGLTVASLATGALGLWLCTPSFSIKELGYTETLSLVERDLARWLVKYGPKEGAVVMAAPRVTTGLVYFGGIRGVATLAPENRSGTLAAIRLCSATSDAEARALVSGRGITHIILASWDSSLEDLGRLGGGQFSGSFIKALVDWRLPYWLRPLPYPMPRIAGFEGQTLWVFEVVDVQDPAIAACRTADFLLELGQASSALPTLEVLRRYPNNLSAWVARASIELANDQKENLAASLKVITQKLTAKADKIMPWDRRVSLAILLARVKETELSKAQTARCLKEAKEENVRQLTPGGIYLLEVLAKKYGLDFEEPDAKKLAWERLSDAAREQLK